MGCCREGRWGLMCASTTQERQVCVVARQGKARLQSDAAQQAGAGGGGLQARGLGASNQTCKALHVGGGHADVTLGPLATILLPPPLTPLGLARPPLGLSPAQPAVVPRRSGVKQQQGRRVGGGWRGALLPETFTTTHSAPCRIHPVA